MEGALWNPRDIHRNQNSLSETVDMNKDQKKESASSRSIAQANAERLRNSLLVWASQTFGSVGIKMGSSEWKR